MNYRALLAALGSLPVLIAIGSYLAGEQYEVVVLRTLDDNHHPHDTTLWIIDHEGTPWVRGIRRNLRWIERVRANPRVELVRNGETTARTASIVETPDEKRAIDEAIAAKYGWLDRLYELVVPHDTIPIRLDPDGRPPGR
jgi:hypothetical protein